MVTVMLKIKSPQDLGAAALLMLLGVVGLWFGQEYTMGTVARMGPGYMPRALSIGLVLFALWIGAGAFVRTGPPVGALAWRPLMLVTAAILVFALLIRPLGLLPTTFLTVLFCGFATPDVRWKEAFLLAAGLAVFVVLVFVYGLNQTISIFGEYW
jgi:hypothetical protein